MSHHLDLRVGSRVFRLEEDSAKIAVTYQSGLTRDDRLEVEFAAFGAAAPVRYEIPNRRMTLLEPDGLSPERLEQMSDVSATFPVFKLNDKRVVLTTEIAVGFDEATTTAADIAQMTDFTLVTEGRGYAILDVPSDLDPMSAVAQVRALPGVAFAEPDLVTIDRPITPGISSFSAFSTGAPVVQQAFINIDLEPAWAVINPISGVTVAVLDDGVDTAHDALSGAVQGAYDAISGAASAQPNPWDFHGTACAGLIVSDAPTFRGIAAGVNLLAVRVAQSPAAGQPWATSNSILRRGIDWAVDNGADVLSNSWGGPPSALLTAAIQRGRDTARGGKGAIFTFAAGNSGGPVEFPGTLSGTIAVGGVNLADEQKTRFSSDGETWWASNVGPEIDITAPAVRIRTSDIAGPPGRTVTDWRDDFNGTSAACPMVAAAAALLLVQDGDLTCGQVAEVLRESADKIGPLGYDADGHNAVFGHGRLNVARALDALSRSLVLRGFVDRVPLSETIAIYVLSPDDAAPLLFTAHVDDEAEVYAAATSGATVAFTARSVVDSAAGPVLIAPRLQRSSAATQPGSGVSGGPAPDEVLLPLPEDDVFAALSAPQWADQSEIADLSQIKGIGSVRQKQLSALGICTLADLGALHGAAHETLRARFGDLVDVSLREDWVGQANALLKKQDKV